MNLFDAAQITMPLGAGIPEPRTLSDNNEFNTQLQYMIDNFQKPFLRVFILGAIAISTKIKEKETLNKILREIENG